MVVNLAVLDIEIKIVKIKNIYNVWEFVEGTVEIHNLGSGSLSVSHRRGTPEISFKVGSKDTVTITEEEGLDIYIKTQKIPTHISIKKK